jgi:excisionase family DNA binding protein
MTQPSMSHSRDGLPFLLTADETATLLRTTRKAIYARAERGLLPGVIRDGRRLLVRRDDLLSWLDERRAASPGGTRR